MRTEYDYIDVIGGTHEDSTYSELDREAMTRVLDGFLKDDKGKTLIDIGCSYGSWAKYFLGMGYDVTGVDISTERLREAERRGYKVVEANATSLPFDNETFDTVVFQNALMHILQKKDRVKAVKEAVRVAKVGSPIIFSIASELGHPFEPVAEHCVYESVDNIEKYAFPAEFEDHCGIHFTPFQFQVDLGEFCRLVYLKFRKLE